jgi:hypothetical protein
LSDRDIMSEPLRGWRGWKVVESRDGPALASWWVSALWPARRALQARCGLHGSRPAAHHVCGIHAFTARDDALDYLDRSHDAVPQLFARRPERALGMAIGRVSGWGRAVRHTRAGAASSPIPTTCTCSGAIVPSLARSLVATRSMSRRFRPIRRSSVA